MKIAFVFHPWDSTDDGGVPGIWNYQITRHLARSSDVLVYSHIFGAQKKLERVAGVEHRRFSLSLPDRTLPRHPRVFFPGCGLRRPVGFSYPYHFVYALRVAMDLRKRNCDIVHLHTMVHFAPIIKRLNPGVPIILHMHGEELSQVDRTMVERKLGKVDAVIGCSEFVSDRIRRSYPRLAERCEAVPMGVDPDRFCGIGKPSPARAKGVKRLLYVGRISPEKGPHVLLDALRAVVKRYPQARLEIVGQDWVMPPDRLVNLCDDPKVTDLKRFCSGNYRSYLESQLTSELSSHVTFRGFVPHERLVDYYRNADVYISPSFYESLGMATIEAMASGTPVIATRVGGVPEVVEDGKSGILVPSGEPLALAEAIIRLLADKKLRSSLAKEARTRAIELFSWGRICEKLDVLYGKVSGKQL